MKLQHSSSHNIKVKLQQLKYFRLKILTVVTIKSIIFWDMTTHTLVEIQLYFRRMYGLHLQGQRIKSSKQQQMSFQSDLSTNLWDHFGPWEILNDNELSPSFLLHFNPEDGSSTFLRNVSQLLPDYIVSHPTKWMWFAGYEFKPSLWLACAKCGKK
jgi:hypothetical protein